MFYFQLLRKRSRRLRLHPGTLAESLWIIMGSFSFLRPFAISLILVTMQCKTPALSQSTVDEIVHNKIGSSYSTNYNRSKTLGLFYQNLPAEKNGTQNVKFIVVELSSHKILEEGKYLNGHVKWHDDTSLEVLDMPGVSKKGQSTSDFKKVIYLKDLTPEKP